MLGTIRFAPALTAAAIAIAALATPAHALVKIGVLTCHVEGGTGAVIYSSKALRCKFRSTSGREERYIGSITRIGLDIGRTTGTSLMWNVFAPGSAKPGALAGSYAGASAQATLGTGVGANVLVGGLKRSITLQPVSLTAQTGLNLAAGVAGLKLRSVR
ncbi:MAG TPA: DUF992 domain-containing protein [Rhodospirillales bacterium]|nr:DUF992 domain-containing protein [Rhodospirillales bacterium]